MKTYIFLLALFLQVITPPNTRATEIPVTPTSQLQLGDDAFEHRYETSVATEERLFVALKKRPAGQTTQAWTLWIWSIDSTGKITQTLELTEPNQSPTLDGPDIPAITVLRDGSLACATVTKKAGLRLGRIKDGHVNWTARDTSIDTNLYISRMVPASDDNLLVLGRTGTRPIYMKITPDGHKLWQRISDDNKPGVVFDGIATNDGGGILVTDFWNGDPFMIGESWIRIAKVDTNGTVTSEKKIRGRRPQIAPSGRGGFVIVYDQSESVGQQVALQAFDERFGPTWSKAVLANKRGLSTLKIAGTMQDDFVIAGGNDLSLFISVVGSGGRDEWSFEDEHTQSSDFNVLSTQNGFVVVYPLISTIDIGLHRALNTKIGVRYFIVNRHSR